MQMPSDLTIATGWLQIKTSDGVTTIAQADTIVTSSVALDSFTNEWTISYTGMPSTLLTESVVDIVATIRPSLGADQTGFK